MLLAWTYRTTLYMIYYNFSQSHDKDNVFLFNFRPRNLLYQHTILLLPTVKRNYWEGLSCCLDMKKTTSSGYEVGIWQPTVVQVTVISKFLKVQRHTIYVVSSHCRKMLLTLTFDLEIILILKRIGSFTLEQTCSLQKTVGYSIILQKHWTITFAS